MNTTIDIMLDQLKYLKKEVLIYNKLSYKDKLYRYKFDINTRVNAFCSYVCNTSYKNMLLEKVKELWRILGKGINLDEDLLLCIINDSIKILESERSTAN